MRRWLGAALAGALVVGVPVLVLADSGVGGSDLERQTFAFRDDPVSRNGTSYSKLVPLGSITICARHIVAATLSAELSGAPAQFRIVVDGIDRLRMHPGRVTFDPRGGRSAFSYTFGRNVFPFEANSTHTFRVDWRSPTGGTVTAHHASVTLQYELGRPGGGGIC